MSDRSAESFDPTATLRKLGERGSVLDGLLRRTLEDWSRFRRRPSRASLARLERRLRACSEQVASARTLLVEPPGRTGTEVDSESESVASLKAELARLRGGGHLPPTGDEPGKPPGQHPPDVSGAHSGAESRKPSDEEGEHSDDLSPENRGTEDSGEAGGSDRGAWNGESPEPAFPSFRDRVTGLLSREGFDAAASGELKRSRRYGRPFALLLFFLRDAAGNPDRLRKVGVVIQRELRESDLVARYGGRTMVVGLPETPAHAARAVADRIAAELRRNGRWDGAASVAVAVHPADGETLPTLVGAARARLDNALGFTAGRMEPAGDPEAG